MQRSSQEAVSRNFLDTNNRDLFTKKTLLKAVFFLKAMPLKRLIF